MFLSFFLKSVTNYIYENYDFEFSFVTNMLQISY